MTRYTSATDADRQEMLAKIGASSLDDLFADIPERLRLREPLALPDGMSEQDVFEHLAALAARNRHADDEVTFVGADAITAAGDPSDKLVPFAFTGPGIPRQGNPIATEHGEGVVTSGTLSPCLEVGIGMGYVPKAAAEPGTPIEVDVRGKRRAAEVRKRPLYTKED